MNIRNRFSAKAYLLSAVSSLAIGPTGLAVGQEGQNLYSNNCLSGNCQKPAATASGAHTAGYWTTAPSHGANRRVVPTSGSIPTASSKLSGSVTPTRLRSASRPAVMAPAQSVAPQPSIAPVAGASSGAPSAAPATGKSEVQKQLEALYRRDGREMPPMDVNSAAAAATAGAAAQANMPKPPPYQPKPSLFDRILGRKPAPTKATPKLALPGKKAVPSAIVAKPNSGATVTSPVEPQPFQAPPSAPAPSVASAPASAAPQTANAGQSATAPPTTKSTEDPAEFFPEVAETKEMDGDTPFSGLKLDEESELPPVDSTVSGAAQTAAADDSREAQYKLLASRAGKPGFRGFCPVTLKSQRKLIDARPQFQSVYQSVVYTFASAEAKEEFDASPASFAPAAGGIDVVAYDDDGDKIPGSLEFAVWYQGRLFMFASQDSLDKFVESPAEYAKMD
jgi:YHS domain-containing protein